MGDYSGTLDRSIKKACALVMRDDLIGLKATPGRRRES
jgi:hypothetical protein